MDDRALELKKYIMEETGCNEQWADFNILRSKELHSEGCDYRGKNTNARE